MKKNSSWNRISNILLVSIALYTVSLIPFKIIGLGFLPPDDAMRHAAKAVSGKDWHEILILRDDIKMDSHPGWHFILRSIHTLTNWNPHQLVLFSVVSLFFLFCFIPILLFKRPEAWCAALLAYSLMDPSIIFRLLFGRPYLVTMTVILIIGFLWPKLAEKKTHASSLTALTLAIAMATWIHGGWYLFALPVIAFFLARQNRAALRLCLCAAIGVAIGAALTGHPILFLKQMVHHAFLAMDASYPKRVLVTEFQPIVGNFNIVLLAVIMLIWRKLRGKWDIKTIDNPMAILAALCWVLGFISGRVWIDMGVAAMLFWLAGEFSHLMPCNVAMPSYQRLMLSVSILAVLLLSSTNDSYGRWSESKPNGYLSLANPDQVKWLPDKGGIVYSPDMSIFYQTFYKNPYADWRYILGFEPALMPPEELAIYRNIQMKYAEPSSFDLWVKKMHSSDRLIIRGGPDSAPKIEGLEWHRLTADIWIGQKSPEKH